MVPGSHKKVDSFVEFYRNQEKNAINKKNLSRSVMLILKIALKYFLKRNQLLPEKYLKKENKPSYPLDASNTKEGKY